MPLYTYVISHGGRSETCQLRKSNPQGWLLQAVSTAFPSVAKSFGAEVMRVRLEPVPGLTRVWRGDVELANSNLVISVSETRK